MNGTGGLTRTTFALTALLAWCHPAPALDPSLDVSQYAHTAWRVREGFTIGPIRSIAQTPDGYLWLGTEFGLVRFDGVRAVPWQPPANQHLPSSTIFKLLAARDGTLWIGTDKGLATWSGNRLTQYPGFAGQFVFALLEDRDGTVWAGTNSLNSFPGGKLCGIHSGSIHCYGEDGTLGRGVLDLYEDKSGRLWASGEKGLWRWRPGTPKFYPLPGEVTGIQTLAEDDDGTLLIGTHSGIKRFVDGKAEAYPIPGHVRQLPFPSLLRDRDGGLWIGTIGRGLIHVRQGRTEVFAQSDGLSGDDLGTLFEDREGCIWVATSSGLDRFRDFAVAMFSAKQGLSNAVDSVLAAKDGSVLLTTSSGLNRWSNGQSTIYGSAAQARRAENVPLSLFQDGRGRTWAVTLREFGYLEDGRFVPISGVPGGVVRSIVEDTAGNLWIANQNAGLFRWRGSEVVERIPWAKLGHKDFGEALAVDPLEGGVWVGFFQGGLIYLKDGKVQASYGAGNGLGEGRVDDLRFGRDGALWAATEGGLSRFKNGHFATLTSRNGLPCDTIHWLIEDDDRSSWLYTTCGLVRVARAELDAWAAAVDQNKDQQRTIRTAVFDVSDGVTIRSYPIGFTPQVAKSADGKLWFPTWGGVSVVDPGHLPFNKLPPPVHIEQITADDQTYAVSNGMHLPALVRNLDIDYTALSLVVPEKVHFRLKLEGQDKDWRELVNDRHVHYTNLAPKHYRFRVTACNNSGVWNQEGASLDFMIPPAWYQTNWFLALCAVAFLALLLGLYQARVHQLRREEKKLREAIETMPTLAWIGGPDGSNQFVNRRWVEYTGQSSVSTEGEGWKAVIHPEDVGRHVRRWLASVASGDPFEDEVRVRGADGEYRWFLSRAVALRDNQGTICRWYGVSTDIEDRKHAEQLQADLAHTNRVSMLGELAASISHELKQPITATITNARTTQRWLKGDQPDLEEVRLAAERIEKDGARASEIIDRLRSLYKKTPPKRELVRVNEIIGEMAVMLRGEATRFGVSIRTDLGADLPKITADRVQLQQVLMNLMLNGIEAMNNTGGVLTVRSEPQDGHVVISVSDTGLGLPAGNSDRIFDAFHTTKPQGSGMGLAISRSIIESHGGSLWATPNDGRGASFYFTLPTSTEAAKAPAARA